MRKSLKACLGAAALLLALPLTAQQSAKEAEKEAGTIEQYEKILRYSGNHDILRRLEGTWQANELKGKAYGTPLRDVLVKDTLESKMILGAFLETDFVMGMSGDEGGAKGKIIMGYDGAAKHFFRLYMNEGDPRGTWSTGVHLRAKNALIFRGFEHDPVSGDKFEKREVFGFGPDPEKITYEQYYTFADGSEIKVLEGTYTRIKKPAPAPAPTPPAPAPNQPNQPNPPNQR